MIGLDCWFKCGWCQCLPETTGWRVVSFAKVDTLPGGRGAGCTRKAKRADLDTVSLSHLGVSRRKRPESS